MITGNQLVVLMAIASGCQTVRQIRRCISSADISVSESCADNLINTAIRNCANDLTDMKLVDKQMAKVYRDFRSDYTGEIVRKLKCYVGLYTRTDTAIKDANFFAKPSALRFKQRRKELDERLKRDSTVDMDEQAEAEVDDMTEKQFSEWIDDFFIFGNQK